MKRRISFIVFLLCLSISLSGQTEKKYKAYMVSNTHLDTQWLWTIQTTIDDYLLRTLTQNFWLIDQYPDYIFNFEGAVRYKWMKEYYPAEYARVKEYVRQGRWNISGSSWDSNDTNMPSPESFFRNLLLGQEFFKKEFGLKCNDIFLPDCFGFGYTLPTIASHSGLIGFSTQKLQHRKFPFYGTEKLPFLFGLWEGIDGSRIFSVPHAQDYITRYQNEDISNNAKLIELGKTGINNTVYSYYGAGDRGGSPTIPSVASIEMGIKGNGPVEIISARSGQIYEDYYPFDKHPELPVFKGELLMDVHATACYTSQAAMKLFNRRNEQLADAAERAAVAAEWLGGLNYPREELRESWERFLWHQFHDDMTGTSIPAVYTFSWNDELISQTKFAETTTTAVGAISRALDTRTKGSAVVVYNPVAQDRKDIVKATIDMPKQPKGIAVASPDGKNIPAQLLSWEDGKANVLFAAQTDPVSFSVFDVRQGNPTSTKDLKTEGNRLENQVYIVTLDRNGDIGSIIDKRSGKELVKRDKAFRLALFPENISLSWPAWELMKKTIDAEPVAISENVKITTVETGPVRATLKVERTYGKSTFVQYISLTNGAADDRIDVVTDIDWNETNALLKAEFPMGVSNKKATYDLGIGFIERGNNVTEAYEVVAQQWADITAEDGGYGISIMNDCKYGWDKPDDNTLRLTLLHTPKVGNDPNMAAQDHMDIGHHTMRYAIVGHSSSITDAGIAWEAEAFNQPLLSFVSPKHPGHLGKKLPFVRCEQPQIAIKALKKAEHGDTYVIRINEIFGKDFSDVEISFAGQIEKALELNGIEEITGDARFKGNKLIISGTAFQPQTFSVTLKKNGQLAVPTNTYLDLPYNATAVTSDAFNKDGNFDGEGNSFSAELMPEIIESDGIKFRVNNKPEDFNYIRCNGQEIVLPEDHAAKKMYLLVTSSRYDRKATFLVDGKSTEFKIPFYSGFYGQWGWKGESEGYLKDGSIAYLGAHRHSSKFGNESYIYTYLYKIAIDIDKNTRKLILPQDPGVALFAVTLSDNVNDDTKAAMEMRAVPYETRKVEYTNEPLAVGRRRN